MNSKFQFQVFICYSTYLTSKLYNVVFLLNQKFKLARKNCGDYNTIFHVNISHNGSGSSKFYSEYLVAFKHNNFDSII